MLTDKQLIAEIRKLSQVKPRKDWVFLTKKEILNENETKPRFSFFSYFNLKPALAGFIVVFVFLGIFGFARNSMPGQPLYILKKIAHFGQAIFVPEAEKTFFQLSLANDRLQDLTKVSPKNLAPTIDEFQANISQAARELTKIKASTSSPAVIKKIVEETKKLEENKQKVESLGVVIDGTKELDNALAKITGDLIGDLQERSLTDQKQETLTEMKELFEKGKYSEVLELYLTSQ